MGISRDNCCGSRMPDTRYGESCIPYHKQSSQFELPFVSMMFLAEMLQIPVLFSLKTVTIFFCLVRRAIIILLT